MTQYLQILIVDDEAQSRDLIRKLLIDFLPPSFIDEAQDVATAVKKLNDNRFDLLFLDVQMRGETGFDLLNKVPVSFDIIFTTAHSEFAVKAFRYSATDYLMKPIDPEEFREAVEKTIKKIEIKKPSVEQIQFLKEIKAANKLPDKLTIPTATGFLFVNISEIVYCHAVGNYTEFYLTNKEKIISSYTLGYYSEILETENFFRIHRSYLINLSQIRMYKKGEGGSIVMNNGEEIEVARSNKENFLKILKIWSWKELHNTGFSY